MVGFTSLGRLVGLARMVSMEQAATSAGLMGQLRPAPRISTETWSTRLLLRAWAAHVGRGEQLCDVGKP